LGFDENKYPDGKGTVTVSQCSEPRSAVSLVPSSLQPSQASRRLAVRTMRREPTAAPPAATHRARGQRSALGAGMLNRVS